MAIISLWKFSFSRSYILKKREKKKKKNAKSKKKQKKTKQYDLFGRGLPLSSFT